MTSSAAAMAAILDLVSIDFLTNAWALISPQYKLRICFTKTSLIFNIQLGDICHALRCSYFQFVFSESQIDTSDFSGSDVLTLSADMSGGNGNVAWQHTQLFRQGIDEKAVHPLELRVTFK
jgi:hypothetical protein